MTVHEMLTFAKTASRARPDLSLIDVLLWVSTNDERLRDEILSLLDEWLDAEKRDTTGSVALIAIEALITINKAYDRDYQEYMKRQETRS